MIASPFFLTFDVVFFCLALGTATFSLSVRVVTTVVVFVVVEVDAGFLLVVFVVFFSSSLSDWGNIGGLFVSSSATFSSSYTYYSFNLSLVFWQKVWVPSPN